MHTKVSVLIVEAPFSTEGGTDESSRDQKNTRINVEVRSITYQPPPAALNPGPKLFALLLSTEHPWFPLSAVLQSNETAVLSNGFTKKGKGS